MVRRSVGVLAAVPLALMALVTNPSIAAVAADDKPITLATGASATLTQSVDTPFVPPKPDIVFVIDRTGSMGPAITDVKSKIAQVVATIQATEPQARFAAVAYCDTGEATPAVSTLSQLSANASSVIDAIISMPLCYGGDLPEAQLSALSQIGNGAINFRPDSNRLIAWFGDAPGHSRLASEASALASLKGIKARVVAASVGKSQLNSSGQASRITRATGGTLLNGVASGAVASSLLAGLTSLPVKVTAKTECDPGLSVDIDTRSITVDSGTQASFEESILLAETTKTGDKLSCQVSFRIDGRNLGPRYEQRITVIVGENTDPEQRDEPSPTPSGEPSDTNPSETTSPSPDSSSGSPTSDPSETEPSESPTAQQTVPADQVRPTQSPTATP